MKLIPGLPRFARLEVSLEPFFLTILPFAAGWSSPVARQAHNLKVAGSNPAPAPKTPKQPPRFARAAVLRFGFKENWPRSAGGAPPGWLSACAEISRFNCGVADIAVGGVEE